jgi:Membrane domain of glycerophosphoryl diester phosphodiesterase
VNPARRLALDQPREVGELFRDALSVYGSHLLAYLAIGAAVVLPVQLIVSGLGLEQLSGPYDSSPSTGELGISTAVSFLVIGPLITAICIHSLRSVAGGEGAAPGRSIRAGLEAFTPLFVAMLLAALGVGVGLVALILPGLYLAIRWFFVPQTVVVEDQSGINALVRSGELVRGRWWRTFGIVVLAWVAAQIPSVVVGLPLTSLAASADRQVYALIGESLTQVVASPFVALVSTLLYYDMRARQTAYRP